MVEYVCFQCQQTVTFKEIERRVICPYCSARIVVKKRTGAITPVKAE